MHKYIPVRQNGRESVIKYMHDKIYNFKQLLNQGVFLHVNYSHYVIPLKMLYLIINSYAVFVQLLFCTSIVHVTAGLAFTGAGIHTAPVHIGNLHNYYAICL